MMACTMHPSKRLRPKHAINNQWRTNDDDDDDDGIYRRLEAKFDLCALKAL